MQLLDGKLPFIESYWLEKLKEEFFKPYFTTLTSFLKEEIRSGMEIYPPTEFIFNAFNYTPFNQVKVVIIGQDPYHGKGEAHGLSFSVPKGVAIPPSLRNIFAEIKNELKIEPPHHGCLIDWARQGVFLLNATLTVRAHQPKSHYGRGWEIFTDQVVALLAEKQEPIVFLLWGKSAADKFRHIESKNSSHLVLFSPHPSPFSAHTGFFGCNHFLKANEFLKSQGIKPIDWSLHD